MLLAQFSLEQVPSLVWLLGGLAAAYVFLVPLLVIATFKVKAHPQVVPFDPDVNPPPDDVVDFFEEMNDQLLTIGFQRYGAVIVPDLMDNVRTVLSLYVHERNQDLAMVTAIWGFAGDQPAEQAKYVEFMAEFDDPELESITTGNNGQVGAFKERPEAHEYRLPQRNDLEAIYRCHQLLLDREAPAKRKSLKLVEQYDGDVARYIGEAVLNAEFARQVPRGYLSLDQANEQFRATFLGGYRISWRVLPPYKYFYEMSYRSQGKQLEQELL